MGSFLLPGLRGDLIDIEDLDHERLVALQAEVPPDGSSATFCLEFSHQEPFRLLVEPRELDGIFGAIRNASTLMINRQRLTLNRGAQHLLELCESAAKPASIEILVDPATADRLFIFQFLDQPPVAIRIAAMELPMMLQQLAEAISRSHH